MLMMNRILLTSALFLAGLFIFAPSVLAATCAQLAPGGTCQSTCLTANVVSGASDCGFLQTCCKPTAATDTCAAAGGTCRAGTLSGGALSCPTGENIAFGTCTNTATPLCCKSTTAAAGGSCSSAGGVCEVSCSNGRSANSSYTCSSGICCTSSAAAAGSSAPVSFTNPLKFDTVQGATAVFLNAFQGIIVMLALIFLVLGGIFYITSGGDSKKIETAKSMITAAMIGLAIGVAAPSFLKEIGNVLGWGGAQVPAEVSGARSAIEVAQAVLDFLLSIVGLLAMVMLVIGGLMFFAAAGDEKRAETAKGIVKYSIMGVAVAVVSLIIVRTIAGLF